MTTHATPAGTALSCFGMVASLGLDVDTVCAAARAGLVRPATLGHYRIRSAVEGDEEPVIGHQATLLTLGFEGHARLLRLAQGALADLLSRTQHIEWRSREHSFYLACARPWREAGAESPPLNAESLLRRAAALAGWPIEPKLAVGKVGDRTCTLEAIAAAVDDLAAGATQLAVVLAVDSLLDAGTLNWLNTQGRLKCDAAPAGLRPGEAAVALVLCPLTSELSRPQWPHIRAIAFADEARSFQSGGTPLGTGLAEVISRLRSEYRAAVPWIIADQNGEVYRAADWGFALVRLRARDTAFASAIVWYPAASVGDTGIVSPLVGVCMAARAWQRRYAPAPVALITACADGQGRGGLALGSSSA